MVINTKIFGINRIKYAINKVQNSIKPKLSDSLNLGFIEFYHL